MKESVQLSLPCLPEYVCIARLTASFIANQMGFDIEGVEDIKLAVGEACNNAVIHSHSSETYQLSFKKESNRLVVEIADNGVGFDLNAYHRPASEQLSETGLGLFIIQSLMDDVTIDTETGSGTKITMNKVVE